MGDEDNFIGHSHIKSLDEDKFVLEPLNFSFHNSSTNNNDNDNNSKKVFSMGSSCLSYEEDASFDERHGKMLKSNSSSSIISQDVVAYKNAASSSSSSSAPSSSSSFILSFENSTMKPSSLHHRPNDDDDHGDLHRYFGGDALCSTVLSSESEHVITKPKAKQGDNKKYRSSSEIQDHIMTERRRRQELTERFIALSATIPGLKKVSSTQFNHHHVHQF